MARKTPRDMRWYAMMSSPVIAAFAAQGLCGQTVLTANNITELRQHISTANGSNTDYVINVVAGTFTISGTVNENANAGGDLDITKAGGSLQIVGQGATTIIDGATLDRVFHVNNGANAPVTIQNLRIQNGRATDNGASATTEARGGGILKEGAGSLTLNGVTVANNEARGAAGLAGPNGVNGAGGNGTAGRSAFGGGVYISAGTVSVASCGINQNAANGGNGGAGGWGGVGTSTLGSLAFSAYNGGNGGAAGAALGGGFFVAGGSLTLDTCNMDQNVALGGNGGNGGLAGGPAWFPANGGTAGSAGMAGGAGVCLQTGTLNMTDTTVSGGSATGGNGGNGGSANIALVSQGLGRAGAIGGAGQGGAVLIRDGSPTIERCTFSGNLARGGNGGAGGQGGMSISFGATGLPGGAGGNGQGGAVYLNLGTIALVNSTFSGNTARGGNGGMGGMGGECASSPSGGIRPGDGGTGGNSGAAQGAGVYCAGGTIAIDNCTTASNTGTAGTPGNGGFPGIGGSQAANSGSAGTTTPTQGGGIFVNGGTVSMASSLFADNSATQGADYFGTAGATLTACLLESSAVGTTVPTGGFITGDPQLSPLANNGGQTQTHAISNSSIARDVGSNPRTLTTDQRGSARNDGNGVDIGSYENGSAPPTGQTNPPVITQPASAVTLNAANYDIQGTAVAGSMVRIYDDANGNGAIDTGEVVVASQQLGGAQTAFTITVALAQNALNRFLATADDPTNTESNPTVVPTITEDSLAPPAPTVTDPATAISVGGASYNIQGTAEAGTLVQIYRDFNNNGIIDAGTDTVVAQQQLSTGVSNFSIATGLTASTTNDFLVTATDGAGNESAPANVPTITENTPAAINPPTITNPGGPVTVDLPAFDIQGNAQANALVRIYTDDNNDGFINGGDTMVASQQLSGGATSFTISVTLAQGVANNFLATAYDGANESLPANVPTITDANPGGGGGGTSGGGGGGGGCAVAPRASLIGLLLLPLAWLRRRRSTT